MPARYSVKPLPRVLAILAHALISGWCLYFLFTGVSQNSPWWVKFLPLVVLFVSLDTLFRHLSSLNSVTFTGQSLELRYPLRPALHIDYARISSLELRKIVTYYVFLGYNDASGKARILKTAASFPRMLEIMYNIADLAPQCALNEHLAKMVKVMRDLNARLEQPSDEV